MVVIMAVRVVILGMIVVVEILVLLNPVYIY